MDIFMLRRALRKKITVIYLKLKARKVPQNRNLLQDLAVDIRNSPTHSVLRVDRPLNATHIAIP